MTTAYKLMTVALAGILLSACGTVPPSSGKPAPAGPTGSAPATPGDTTEPPLAETEIQQLKTVPTVLIEGRTAEAILDDIEQYRTSRGMTVAARSKTRIEFVAGIVKAKRPTQARIRYVLVPVKNGFNLSARVFQVSYPGTGREKVADITAEVADRLGTELTRYTQSGGAWR
ncbi:hypothetical protein GCM10007860_19610 [Chitiniphilus shinanonensis]|uniref:Lipoprotein n=1 Tax=Chitiniphilus shinanonensis TaxID=553088 RepID=A0ABQ6BT54_9NEIS|nr:hypothetical protein [Chitiniphilus shinanonensis]GLS04813.1 hypothetical protein GCM10007860_19610 [Chitiniphilus shinanonensis]